MQGRPETLINPRGNVIAKKKEILAGIIIFKYGVMAFHYWRKEESNGRPTDYGSP